LIIDRLLPTSHVALLVLVLALGSGTAAAITVSVLRARGVRVAYTRKLFHITIFTVAAGVHTVWALPGTMVFGTVIVAIVLASLWAGEGHQFYEALARDTDRPHRTLFILVPMLTTALGGLASALLVGPYASVGYLATGWGDAVGEPVGARWGRHPYRVPSLGGVPATRTLEGSLAVFLVASLGSGLALLAMEVSLPAAVGVGVASGAGAAIVEAGSHHGLDNLTVQVAASLIASWLLT
jgi:phytol kinase